MLIPKIKRFRSKAHLKAVASLPCVICGTDHGVQAHHEIGTGHGAMGMKAAPDDRTFPLCHQHHFELHRWGHETWEEIYGAQSKFIDETNEALK